MNKDIELSALPSHQTDVEKGNFVLKPNNKAISRKLGILMILDVILLVYTYLNYEILLTINPLLAPTVLGALTAALAQIFNQFIRNTYTLNKIFKFIIWGSLNGCFTAIWIDYIVSIDNFILRILVDQSVGAPGFQIMFSILNSLWDYGALSRSTVTAFLKSLKYSYCFWPFVSMLVFGFLPKDAIFPCNCAAALLWNIILSRLA